MPERQLTLDPAPAPHLPVWRDVAIVIAITGVCVAIAARLELNETLYRITRQWEFAQLDEVPLGLLILALCLVWLSWRRYKQARAEILARQATEAQLAGVLTENRRLAQAQLLVQEEERKNLARELHDELGQYLNAIKLDAVSIYDPATTDLDFTRRTAFDIIQMSDHIHAVVSDMIRRLRPVGLDELGLVAALEHCIDHWRQRRPETRFSLRVEGNFDGLDEPTNLTLYRIMQEALTNAYKHAEAHHVDVSLERNTAFPGAPETLKLSISDDGRGMPPQATSSGYGLNGMRERVEMIGGMFVLESAPGNGVCLTALLPASH
ncbi:MAG TPA: sensor histidine kinase [Steroidobacteraceae bacterium]